MTRAPSNTVTAVCARFEMENAMSTSRTKNTRFIEAS